MVISCQLFMLVSTAVTNKRDKSIIYSRLAIKILLYSLFVVSHNIYYWFNDNALIILSGLITITALTQTFHLFTIFICFIILQLTSFYPKKIYMSDLISDYYERPRYSIPPSLINKLRLM